MLDQLPIKSRHALGAVHRNVLLVALLACTAHAIAPRAVHASDESGLADLDGLVLAVPVVSAVGMFLTIDVVYSVRGRWLPKGWAIAQLLTTTPFLFGYALLEKRDMHEAREARAWCVVLGTWFLGHGVLSLVLAEASPKPTPPPTPPSNRRLPRGHGIRLSADVVPLPDGVLMMASARL